MSSSVKPDKLSLHGKIKQAIGPYFLWLQIDEAETRCVVRLGDRAFPPVVLPVGLPALVPPSPRGKAPAPAAAMSILKSGVLLSNTKFRQAALKAIQPGLQPATDLLGSLRRQARAVPAVILDASPSEIPGLRETFQELLPDQPVLLLQDLKLDETADGRPVTERSPSAERRALMTDQRPTTNDQRPTTDDHGARRSALGDRSAATRLSVGPITWLVLFAVFGFGVLGVLGLQRMDLVRGEIAGVTRSLTTLRHDLFGQLPLPVPVTVRPMVAPHLPRVAESPAIEERRPTTNDRSPIADRRSPSIERRGRETAPHGDRRSAIGDPERRERRSGAQRPRPQRPGHPPRRISAALDLLPSAEAPVRHPAAPGGRPTSDGETGRGGEGVSQEPGARSQEPGAASAASAARSQEPGAGSREPGAASEAPAGAPRIVTPTPPSSEALLSDLPSVAATISSPLAARLSLADALRRVTANDLEVQAATWRREGQEAVSRSAGDLFRLQGSLEGGVFTSTTSLIFDEGRSAVGSRDWSALFGSMEIDVTGRRKGLKKTTAAVRQQGNSAIDRVRERAAYDTALLYVDALRASAETEARQEVLTLEREGWRAVQARLARGDVSRLDLAQAMNRVATAQSHLAAALVRQEVAELNLGACLRVASGSRVQPDPDDTWLTTQVTRIASQPARTGAAACAEVVEAAARVKRWQALNALARKGDPLRLTAHGGVAFSGSEVSRPKPLVGLRLSIPFATSKAKRFRMREAQAHLEEATALHQKTIETVTAEIVAVQVELLRSRERLSAAGAALTAAREAVRLAQLRYQAGYSPLADLLQAQAQLSSALMERADLQHAERRAQIELLRLTGHLVGTAPS